MAARKRVTRPKLERKAPVRRWATIFGVPPESQSDAPSTEGNPVSRGVDLGYRVIEEYIRQGQEVARAVWAPGASGDRSDPQRLTERMVQYASDLTSVWMELMQTVMGTAAVASNAPRPPRADPGPFDIGGVSNGAPPPGPVEAPAISVALESRRRAEVTVDLRPGIGDGAFLVHDLRPSSGKGPRLSGVKVERAKPPAPVVVRVRVPDALPAGLYTGMVIDPATNLPQGTIAVQVHPGRR